MKNKFDDKKKKKIFEYFDNHFPDILDLTYSVNENIITFESSTSIADSNVSLNDINFFEEILSAEFLGFVTMNGKYATRYKFL